MNWRLLSFYYLPLISLGGFAQANGYKSSSEILLDIKKLGNVSTVLYVAAHPDDENTRLISWFAKERLCRTVYLSLTRGDGGQNLIGTEKAEYIGVIRTQELLEARKIDGGIQHFTRANDFGYSKTADETFSKWGKDAILADVVWAIRKYKPDIIINRFPPTGDGGHGHHTASAILSIEAFDLANDAKAFPEQLKYVSLWQPERLYWNAWMVQERGVSEDSLIKVDVGTYNPLIGKSYTELAGLSRSMHKSQGFGASQQKGSRYEYLSLIKGSGSTKDPLEGMKTDWSRINGCADIQKRIDQIIKTFNPQNPSASVRQLKDLYLRVNKVEEEHWRKIKSEEIRQIIQNCLGLWLEINAKEPVIAPEEQISIELSVLMRGNVNATLKNIRLPFSGFDSAFNQPLNFNTVINFKKDIIIDERIPISQPYWLTESEQNGIYQVSDQQMIGIPENTPGLMGVFGVDIEGVIIEFSVPLICKKVDPVDGEIFRVVSVSPSVFMDFTDNVVIAKDGKVMCSVKVKSGTNNVSGSLTLRCPNGWTINPPDVWVNLAKKGDETIYSFEVIQGSNSGKTTLGALFTAEGKSYNRGMRIISYKHIPTQVLYPVSELVVVAEPVKASKAKIGYIMGPGDEVPQGISQMGFDVELLDENKLENNSLTGYKAIIAGVRSYNTLERLKYLNQKLFDYVSNGGTYIVQYNTNRGLVTEQIAPKPLTLGRGRVTEEEAEMRILEPNHPVFNYPNNLTNKDFEGWVQERGLYFADKWDDQFVPLIACHDTGEKEQIGGLLYLKYGKGHYIYTGIAFFREIPAGVPGSFKLLSNLLLLSDSEKR